MGHASKERVLLIGTDQRITSGQQPKRLHSKAGYMAAPERFAKRQIRLLHRGRCRCRPGESANWGAAEITGTGGSALDRRL